MLTYPAWCSAVDRAVIESALAEACPPQLFIVGPRSRRSWGGAPEPDPSPRVSEPVAVQTVVKVAQVVASRRTRQDPDAEDLLAQIIVCVAERRASPTSPLPIFETKVHEALRACPWWSSPVPLPPASVPDKTTPYALPPLLTLREAAKRLRLSVDTLERMERDGELEIRWVGKGKKRRVSVTELHRLLALNPYRYRDR